MTRSQNKNIEEFAVEVVEDAGAYDYVVRFGSMIVANSYDRAFLDYASAMRVGMVVAKLECMR